MAGEAKNAAIQETAIDEIELDSSEITELNKMAEETRKCATSWEDLTAEIAL